MAAQSYDKIDGVIWYDGKLVNWADANVHILTHCLHYASCVFEGERAYGGEVFKSTAHSERLKRSANILDFEIPYSVTEIYAAKQLVIEKNGRWTAPTTLPGLAALTGTDVDSDVWAISCGSPASCIAAGETGNQGFVTTSPHQPK